MHFAIISPTGNSDHLKLEMISDGEVFGKVVVKKELLISFEKLLKDSEKIKPKFEVMLVFKISKCRFT